MAIQALERFREKFPAYADRSDEELAQGLATKYPREYGKLPSMVAREKVIGGYNSMTQDSARKAEDRVNMLQKFGEELAYVPGQDKRLNILGKTKAHLLKLPVTALKGAGALGQVMEGAISSPIVAAQRGQNPLQPEFYDTIKRSVAGEAPTEYGDVLRNVGVPERIAALGGLAASAMTPGGYGKLTRIISKQAGAGTKGLAKSVSKVGPSLAKTHLDLFTREAPEAAENLIKKDLSMIKPGQSLKSIQDEVTAAVSKTDTAVRTVQKRASRVYDSALSRYSDDVVDMSQGKVLENAVLKGNREFGITSRLDKAGKPIGLIGNRRIPGSQTLADIMDDLGKSPVTTVGRLRIKLKELDGLIKSNLLDATNAEKSISTAASNLASEIRKAINAQSTGMGKYNAKYQNLTKYLHTDEATKLPNVQELLKTNTTGGTKLNNYFALRPEAKAALEGLDAQLPSGRKFLEQLKDASTNQAYSGWLPRARFSLMAPGAMLFLAGQNPASIGLMAAGAGLSSPRASALAYKGLSNLSKGTNKVVSNLSRSKVLGKPVGQAIEALTERGVLGPGLTRGVTRNAFMGSEEQEQQ